MTTPIRDEDGFIIDMPKIPIDEELASMAFESIDNALLDCSIKDNELSFCDDEAGDDHD